MSQQIEHEFKNLVTATEFKRLQQHYPFATPFNQTNLYFDTRTQQLQRLGWGLRLRVFTTHAEQTLKVPFGQDRRLQEITDQLPLAQARQVQLSAPSQVSVKLATEAITFDQLQLIGFAKTQRQQAQLSSGLLVLDKTVYADGLVDYEIELEVQQTGTSVTAFQALLTKQHISVRKVANKVQRAKQHFSPVQREKWTKNLQQMLFD